MIIACYNNMRTAIFIALLLLFVFCISCDQKAGAPPNSSQNINEPTREASILSIEKPKTIFIPANKEPIETCLGYIRVSGIIFSNSISAILEIGGNGIVVGQGDQVQDYKIQNINESGVVLLRSQR